MFEAGEAACDHAVPKEERWLEWFNEAFVKMGQTELPSFPSYGVVFCDETGCSSADRAHSQVEFDDFQAGGKQEATLDWCVYDDLVSECEGARHGFFVSEAILDGRRSQSCFAERIPLTGEPRGI